MSIKFTDNSKKVKELLDEALLAGLYEAGGVILSQTKQNSRVASGQTRDAWKCVIDEEERTATIGNPLANSVWEEFGTGEYAFHGDGRKGGWYYVDEDGIGHFTYGKRPIRMLFSAFCSKKNTVIRIFQKHIKDSFKWR